MQNYIIKALKSVVASAVMAISISAYASPVVYDKPDETVKESEYKVYVAQNNGAKQESFVYLSEVPKYDTEDPKSGAVIDYNGTDDRSDDTLEVEATKNDGANTYRLNNTTQNFTTFSIDSTATVTVETPEKFDSVRIIPERYGIKPKISSDKKSLSFEIEPTQKVFVEFDGELIDRLYIFADPLEDPTKIPDKNASHVFVAPKDNCLDGLTPSHTVLYFSAGASYNVEQYGPIIPIEGAVIEDRIGYNGAWTLPEHVKQIYIEGGALVDGGFVINHNDVIINGRGIISGRNMVYHQMNLIEFNPGTKNGYVEGITLSDGVHFSLRGWNAQYDGENFKVIANWRYNNDGINVPENAHIKNCYISGNDDTVKFYFGGSTLENCVIGQMVNGAVFQFGWGPRNISNVTAKNIDILHYDGSSSNQNIGIINYRPRGESGSDPGHTMENILFDGIYVDNPAPRLISLGLPEYQHVKGLTVQNVEIDRFTGSPKNYIKGSTDKTASGTGTVTDIVFKNIKINGKELTEDNYLSTGNFEEIDSSFMKNIEFK